MAVAVGAGASNATGQSTATTIISGIASFRMAVWATSRRHKVRFVLGISIAALHCCFMCLHCLETTCLMVNAQVLLIKASVTLRRAYEGNMEQH